MNDRECPTRGGYSPSDRASLNLIGLTQTALEFTAENAEIYGKDFLYLSYPVISIH